MGRRSQAILAGVAWVWDPGNETDQYAGHSVKHTRPMDTCTIVGLSDYAITTQTCKRAYGFS